MQLKCNIENDNLYKHLLQMLCVLSDLFCGSVSYRSSILCNLSGTNSQSILTLEYNFKFGLQMVQLLRVLPVKSQIKLSMRK